MKTRILLTTLLMTLPVATARPAEIGIAPASISVPAPFDRTHNPHRSLGVSYHSWIVVPATITVAPDGRVGDLELRPVAVAALDGNLGTFQHSRDALVPEDADRFERAARAALTGARFEKSERGGPRRSFVNLAWKAVGGSMDVGAAESGGSLRHARDILARTFAKGTTFYLWRGLDVAIEAKRFETVSGDNRRDVLGLPSTSLVEKLSPDCEVRESAPDGTWSQNLDAGLQPLEPIQLEYPERERRRRTNGTVLLVVQVSRDGSVSAVYPMHTTPGHPAFAESAIRAACRLEYNEPRSNGEAVVGLTLQHAAFTIEGP